MRRAMSGVGGFGGRSGVGWLSVRGARTIAHGFSPWRPNAGRLAMSERRPTVSENRDVAEKPEPSAIEPAIHTSVSA